MDVEFWKGLWGLVLLLGCLLFLGLALVVTVGGIADVKALFHGLRGDLAQRRKGAKEER